MTDLCILIGAGLLIVTLAIVYFTKERSSTQGTSRTVETSRPSPPPLPPRSTSARTRAPSTESHIQTRTTRSGLPPLPPRHTEVAVTATAINAGANRGPHNIRPSQFPCCPFCKQRNTIGGRQMIFWDSEADGYRCSRGHRFRKNGKP